MEEQSVSKNQYEILSAVGVTFFIIALIAFGVWYFFAPPPELSLQGALDLRTQERALLEQQEAQGFAEAKAAMGCGAGISGSICRLGQSACGTALGGYFCYTEGRDTGE